MQNLDNAEENLSADAALSTNQPEAVKTESNNSKQDNPSTQTNSESDNDNSESFNFFSIEPLNFRKTPRRNQELYHFRNVLHSPFINVPLLVVQRQEDILPVLSLYVQEEQKQKN